MADWLVHRENRNPYKTTSDLHYRYDLAFEEVKAQHPITPEGPEKCSG